jgi:hypothetical protein
MSQPAPHPIRNFFTGLRNIADFVGESALALIKVAMGRWPRPFGEAGRKPNAPNQGLGPIEKIAPFPVDD